MFARRSLSGLGLAAAVGLAGCAAKTASPPQTPPPSAESVEQIRASYTRVFPDARVGLVTAVLPDAPYALVGEIDTGGLTVGNVVSFLDADETVVANGVVEKVEPSALTVRFDTGLRRPVAGDAAIKF